MTQWLKPKDVAQRLGVSQRTALYIIARGELPSVRLGPQTIRIDAAELDAYLKRRAAQ